MSDDRLYYTDAYLIEFDAVVREVEKQGDRWLVTLDRTGFYPTSGGQPFDMGTLGEAKILDVFEREDGTVAHALDREIEKDARVRGLIDWPRRFDHMQQHTGQHLLSAAFDRELGARTISFHLGASSATIDLDKELTAEQLEQGEAAANKVLWDDREVCVKTVTAGEASKLPLRKEPARAGDLRIVEITDYDMSACGGTHVNRTGAIGMIGIAGSERFKGGTRVEFVCGERALRVFHGLRDAVSRSVRLLSVLPADVSAAVEKLQGVNRAQQKAQETLRERLAIHEAGDLTKRGQQVGRVTLIAEALEGWDPNGLKKLASAIAANAGTVVVLLTTESPMSIVVARSQDLTTDAGALLRQLIDRFGGKGGGKGSIAQGGGLSGSPSDILTAARDAAASL